MSKNIEVVKIEKTELSAQEDVFNKKLVIQDDALIFASYSLSLEELRLIETAIEKHHTNKALYKGGSIKTTITVMEYSELYDVERVTAYQALSKSADSLFEKTTLIREKDCLSKERWLQGQAIYESGKISLHFSELVSKYINEVVTSQTAYRLAQASKLNNTNAKRLFAIFQTVIDPETLTGEWTIEIEELKYILQIENLYPRWVDFKRRIVNKVVEQIEKDTSLTVEYEISKREGRAAKELTFKVTESEQLSLPLNPNVTNDRIAS